MAPRDPLPASGEELIEIAEKAIEDATPEDPRAEELLNKPDIRDQVVEVHKVVEDGYDAQQSRTEEILSYWDLYNCRLGPKQVYSGNSQLFVPLIHDAVQARKTRFVNQMFPRSERCVEAVSSDGAKPRGLTALMEHYIRKAMLRSQVMPALMVCGDVEGQYSIYVHWAEIEKWITTRSVEPAMVEDLDFEDPDADVDVSAEERIVDASPRVEVISDADLCVLPAESDSIEEALQNGGSVTVLRRWTKAKIEKLRDEDEIDEEAAKKLLEHMTTTDDGAIKEQAKRAQTDAAGIRRDSEEALPYALIYETWTILELKEGRRICRIWSAGSDCLLSVKRNPNWQDLLPIISAPVEKVHGSFKGRPKVKAAADFQIAANDAINEAMDSAAYALMPIIMTDPTKNPRVGSMILSLAAIWETSPQDTQFAEFPQLWKDGFEIVNQAKQQIFQTLSVNPAQITQGNPYRKPTQAEIAAEQQVDVLTTADAVTGVEQGILTPMLTVMVSMDQQYRRDDIAVQSYGELGQRAAMEKIEALSFDKHWQFRWFGVEAARAAQQIQQQISAINVVRTIPPQLYAGYELNLAPAITNMMEAAFGPSLSLQVWKDLRSQLSQNPEEENQALLQNLDLPIHPLDDHNQHLAVHIQAFKQEMLKNGAHADPNGAMRIHIMQHQQAQMQQMAAATAQIMGASGGAPQGAAGQGDAQQPLEGRPGEPRPGAQVSVPRPQGPPGMIARDQMRDPAVMPRTVGTNIQ